MLLSEEFKRGSMNAILTTKGNVRLEALGLLEGLRIKFNGPDKGQVNGELCSVAWEVKEIFPGALGLCIIIKPNRRTKYTPLRLFNDIFVRIDVGDRGWLSSFFHKGAVHFANVPPGEYGLEIITSH